MIVNAGIFILFDNSMKNGVTQLFITTLALLIMGELPVRLLAETGKVFHEQIYVQEGPNSYYYYKVYSEKGAISITVLDHDTPFSSKSPTFSTFAIPTTIILSLSKKTPLKTPNTTGSWKLS